MSKNLKKRKREQDTYYRKYKSKVCHSEFTEKRERRKQGLRGSGGLGDGFTLACTHARAFTYVCMRTYTVARFRLCVFLRVCVEA